MGAIGDSYAGAAAAWASGEEEASSSGTALFDFFRFLRSFLSRTELSASSSSSDALRFFCFFVFFSRLVASASSALFTVSAATSSPSIGEDSRALWNGPIASVPSFSLCSKFSKSRFCRHAMPLGSFWLRCMPMPSMSSFCDILIAFVRPSPDAPSPLEVSQPNFSRYDCPKRLASVQSELLSSTQIILQVYHRPTRGYEDHCRFVA